MDYVPSMAAIAAAAQKSQTDGLTPPETTKAVTPVAKTALDPRPAYTLAPGTADAMLSLAKTKVDAADAAEFDTRYGHSSRITQAATAAVAAPVVAPEPAKAVSAANRNWNEDVRLDHIPTRKVGEDTVVQYEYPQVVAIWNAAFPNVTGRKNRAVLLGDTKSKLELKRPTDESGLTLTEKAIYLLCSSDNFRLFSQDHPETHIEWIAVDNDDILWMWPKETGHQHADASGAPLLLQDLRDPEA